MNDWNHSARSLLNGELLLVDDLYSTGLNTLAALRRRLEIDHPDAEQTHDGAREFRSRYQQASQNLLAPITSHRLDLEKAPEIGWFEELYADVPDFLLPFPQIQGLNSAWQWWQKGIVIPVLKRRLFPFYGTYFPTRSDHLELFDSWLQQYDGPRRFAWDIGTGCGVMALQLIQAGFDRVLATDSNANAVESVRRDLTRQSAAGLDVRLADLFGVEEPESPDLVVFNPPWIEGDARSPIDSAIYHDGTLFERFFEQAHARLAGDSNVPGRLVVLFSNLPQTVDPTAVHPIQHELDTGDRFALLSQDSRPVRTGSSKTRRRKRDATQELVELWVLIPKPEASKSRS
jgi:hypothetical protein